MAEKRRKESGKRYGEKYPKSKSEVLSNLTKPLHTRKQLAKMASVSEGTFYRFEQIKDKIDDKTRWDLITGKERNGYKSERTIRDLKDKIIGKIDNLSQNPISAENGLN